MSKQESKPADSAPAPKKAAKNGVMRGSSPAVPAEAPLYLVKHKDHFINGRVVNPGDRVRYAGVPGVNLEPLDDAARQAVADAEEARDQRKAEAATKASSRLKLLDALNAL